MNKTHILSLSAVVVAAIFHLACGATAPEAPASDETHSSSSAAATDNPPAVATDSSPRLIAYYNANTDPILDQAETLPYTHYILAFLVPDGKGGVKPSGALEGVLADPGAIRRVQAAGKKVMISVGGGTIGGDDWLQLGQDAGTVAESIAQIVEQHGLDGVDFDIEAVPFETRSAFQPYADAAIALTRAVAERLPSKLLTHAPQPPYLCAPGSPGCPEDSLYAAILAATGDQISWLNMQYYSNPPVTSLDVDEVASYNSIVNGWNGFAGLEPGRLVVGKPYSSRVNGFEPVEEVVSKILQPLVAEHGSSAGGFMAWEFSEDPDGTWARTVAKALGTE